MLFPTRNDSNQKGVSGQAYFQHFVNTELKCIYHPIIQENDFGIDGYIELVVDKCVTGKLIGVQIKHGNSFFNSRTDYGYKYIGNNKHLNYYLNNQCPIFIVIMDEDFNRKLWIEFDLLKTMPVGSSGWWIEVLEDNYLDTNFHKAILAVTAPVIDFEKQIEMNWRINSAISNSDYRVLAIPKDEIIRMSFSYVNDFLSRLSVNKHLLLESRSSLDIFFPEYDNDPCEITQIPEIMKWLRSSIEFGIPWFYFLDTRHMNTGLHLLIHSYCLPIDISKHATGYLVNYDNISLVGFIEKNFLNLNNFTNNNSIGLSINEEVSKGITEYLEKYLI